jgi:hypothetical protein
MSTARRASTACGTSVGDLVLAEADFPADFDADTAASHTMSGRLPLREIERVAEGAQQFRERDLVELPWGGRRGFHGRGSGQLQPAEVPGRSSKATPDHERINRV